MNSAIELIEYDPEVIQRMNNDELTRQLVYQGLRLQPNAEHLKQQREALATATARINEYADKLAADGFADLAAQVREVI